MWKFVTRGIRETLERRASCRTNVYSQTSNDGTAKNEVKTNLAREQKFLAPNIVSSCNSGFWGSTKNDGPKDKRYDSKWDTGRSWSEAVGWSSVLAVGWVVCQSLCHRARLFEPSKDDKRRNRLLRLDGAPPSLANVYDLRPRRVLPVTNCIGDSRFDGRKDYSGREGTGPAPRPYGPITIEEALREAKDDYTKTHRIVMGEFELRFGVKALEEKRHEDAIEHFSTGASLSSSGSMFNLGLCHELGIGTVTDAMKAAKYYKNAAERGHPDAMYNLGVFHAQGRGGLSLDVDKARELFVRAADLGQTQARIALEMEEESRAAPLDERATRSEIRSIAREAAARRPLRVDQCEASASSREISAKLTHYDESPEFDENPTDAFLRSLGIRTNRQPILVGGGDSNVPCYS